MTEEELERDDEQLAARPVPMWLKDLFELQLGRVVDAYLVSTDGHRARIESRVEVQS